MSGQNKRILPPSASTTAALIPISQSAAYGGSIDRSSPNEALIDQLVGGLIQTQQPPAQDSSFFNHNADFAANSRTYSIDDEEIDEPPVPIPSTWRQQQPVAEPNWYVEQLRASAYGFAIGLFVVIPAVMLLTGQTERIPSWQAVISYAKATGSQLGLDTLTASSPAPAPTTKENQKIVAAAPVSVAAAPVSVAAAPVEKTEPDADLRPVTQPVAASIAPKLATPNLAPLTAAPAKSPTVAVVQVQPVAIEKPAATEAGSEASTTSALTASETQIAAVDPNSVLPQPSPLTAKPAVESAPAVVAPKARPPAERPQQRPAAVAAVEPGPRPSPVTVPAKSPNSIAIAHEKIKGGEMDEARIMLARLASQGNSNAVFALAETFDPNVLAAWGTHGEEANSEKAKMFYSMALSQGVSRAEMRIKALQP